MKQRLTNYILFLLSVFALSACHEDSDPVVKKVNINTQVVDVDEEKGVTLRVVLSSDVDKSSINFVRLRISDKSDLSNATEINGEAGLTSDTFYCLAPHLQRDTKYYFTYEVGNYMSYLSTGIHTFTVDKNFNLGNVWFQVAPFTGGLRSGGVSFALDDKGYYGLGKSGDSYLSDLWQYDPVADSWRQLSDFPSTGLDMAISFVIGDTAYVSLGRFQDESINGYNLSTYSYDVTNDKWKKIQSFPGVGRTGSVSFELEGKGYVVGGYKEKETYTDEVWCFDPKTDSWSQKKNFPLALTGCYTFTLKDVVYVGGGYNLKTKVQNTNLYKYDVSSDSWSIAYSNCEPLIYSTGFSAGEKCYVAGGEGEIGTESVFLSFDGKDWATMGSFGEIRKKSSSFVLGESFYLVCGENDLNIPLQTVLKYTIK